MLILIKRPLEAFKTSQENDISVAYNYDEFIEEDLALKLGISSINNTVYPQLHKNDPQRKENDVLKKILERIRLEHQGTENSCEGQWECTNSTEVKIKNPKDFKQITQIISNLIMEQIGSNYELAKTILVKYEDVNNYPNVKRYTHNIYIHKPMMNTRGAVHYSLLRDITVVTTIKKNKNGYNQFNIKDIKLSGFGGGDKYVMKKTKNVTHPRFFLINSHLGMYVLKKDIEQTLKEKEKGKKEILSRKYEFNSEKKM